MKKIFRLTRGEIKKIFLSPIIFVMTAVLILALTLAPKLFSPAENVTTESSVTLNGYKVTQIYSSFLNEYKSKYENSYTSALNEYHSLIENPKDKTQNLSIKMNDIKQSWSTFLTSIDTLERASTEEEIATAKNNCLNAQNLLRDKIISFESYYTNLIQQLSIPLILITNQTDMDIQDNLGRAKSILAYSSSEKNIEYFKNIKTLIENFDCINKLENNIAKIKDLSYSTETLQTNYDYLQSLSSQKISVALGNVTRMNQDASLDAEFDANEDNQNLMKNLIIRYLSACDNATKTLQNDLKYNVIADYGDIAMAQYMGFENANSYRLAEAKNKYCYLLENDFTDSDFASTLSFNKNSSQETNAFDYMYFAMEIVSVVIIAFTVVLGAGMIAKEHSQGTIKLLAIRPYKRWKIIIAKALATLFFGFVFMLVSAVVSLITGIIVYGISFPSMLVVFNASTVFVAPIWTVFLIYLATLMLKIWVYALLAIAISTIFNSYIASVCIAVGLYATNIIVTFVSRGATWLRYNIFANIDLFKYFGGSFSSSYNSLQNLTNLFSSPVFPGVNFNISLVIIGCFIVILNIAMLTVFNKKDIV
ncbi:MAG: ABC transporter permease [Christensenellales bacterium]